MRSSAASRNSAFLFVATIVIASINTNNKNNCAQSFTTIPSHYHQHYHQHRHHHQHQHRHVTASAFISNSNTIHNFQRVVSSSKSKSTRLHNNSATTTTSTQAAAENDQGDFRITSTIPETVPLSKNTFAGQVEQAVMAKYGTEETQRIVQSWRLLDKDYEHHAYVGTHDSDDIDNVDVDVDVETTTETTHIISPNESNCYQYAHSYVDGLECKPFWDISQQSWANKLSNKHKTIRRELFSVLSDEEKINEGNNVWAGALTEEAGGYGEGWSTLVLMNRGMWDEVNCNLFPQTAKAVQNSGIPATEVFFASMKPHSDIKLHSDFTNFVLTSHLAVEIPENGDNKCRLSVGDETREWINGEVTLFDTSIMHDAINETDDTRYILMFRVWHPDLTEVEKNALQLIYDCLEFPDLLSEDENKRQKAEIEVVRMRSFPKLKSASAGFGSKASASGGGKKKKKGKR